MQLGPQLDPPPARRWFRGLGAVTGSQIAAAVTKFNQATGADPPFDPNQVAAAVNLFSTGAPLVARAITSLQAGNQAGTYAAASAIVAGAVAVANPVAGAIVGGVLAAAGAIGQAFGLFNNGTPATTCAWKFPPTPEGQRGVCFGPDNANYIQPQGPQFNGVANPKWLSLATFANTPLLSNSAKQELNQGVPCFDAFGVNIGSCSTSVKFDSTTTVTGPDNAVWSWSDPNWSISNSNFTWLDDLNTGSGMPFGYRVLECAAAELAALGDTGVLATWWRQVASNTGHDPSTIPNWNMKTPGMQAFALTYARAFQQALEFPLNGFQFFGGQQLLFFLVQAWNTKYAQYASSSQTFDGSGSSLVDMAINGYIDQWASQGPQHQYNIPGFNGLPAGIIIDPPASALAAGAPGTLKAGIHPAAVVGVTAGSALVGAAAIGFVAQQSIGAVFGNAFDSVRKGIGIRWPWER